MKNKHPSAVNDAAQSCAKIFPDVSGLLFKPVPGYETTDGVHSPWPQAKIADLKKEAPASTAAKGDDGLMSTPAKPTKS